MKLARTRALANPDIQEILLFLDNSAVVDGILGPTPASSQGAYMGLRQIAQKLLPRVTTRVAWVPGHKDVLGNEEADRLAKEGSELPCLSRNCSTITFIK
ncbi:pyruvate decarboxylase, partial [Trichoderma harzianum]